MNEPRSGGPLWLGLDTGGTFTDAVLLEGGCRVLAHAKALTTPWDLAVGLISAIARVLESLPAASRRADVDLVSVSTTLATNAVVEGRFSPVCTLLIGFDDAMAERTGLAVSGAGSVVRIAGGHTATGEEAAPLDESAASRAVAAHDAGVEAFAVAGNFSVRNPAHELRIRQLIRRLSPKPVTCAHEMSSRLDAPRRALTAALNARLTPQIQHLIEALSRALADQRIAAPLMIVKGDGSLMKAEVALEYPVETLLSGPAASVVGASFLTGLQDFIVSDMGGTTTDIAVVSGGRPVVGAEGALVGGWRTMVEAVDVRTSALGGDSEVRFDRRLQLRAGPRKVMPLCLLAHRFPAVLGELQSMAERERVLDPSTQFAFRNPDVLPQAALSGLERRVWDTLDARPRPVATVIRNGSGLQALHRLADARLVTVAAFTPTDAMHGLGLQSGWSPEAALLGARILATEERNSRAVSVAATPLAICERIHDLIVCETSRALISAALAQDPGIDERGESSMVGGRLVDAVVAGRPFSSLLAVSVSLGRPLVAIGAPVGAYYPEVARRLDARLTIPDHAAVCNAVGAVVGVVAQRVEILVNQPSFGVFRVHDPAGSRDYPDAEAALAHACQVSRDLALAAACRAGAVNPHVETHVTQRRATSSLGLDYFAEAVVRCVATGRPLLGRRQGIPAS